MTKFKSGLAVLGALILALSLVMLAGPAQAGKGNSGGQANSVKIKDPKVKLVLNEDAARVKLHAARLMSTDVATVQVRTDGGEWVVAGTAVNKCPKGKKTEVRGKGKGKVKEGKCTAKLRVAALDGEWKAVVSRGDKTFESKVLTLTPSDSASDDDGAENEEG